MHTWLRVEFEIIIFFNSLHVLKRIAVLAWPIEAGTPDYIASFVLLDMGLDQRLVEGVERVNAFGPADNARLIAL